MGKNQPNEPLGLETQKFANENPGSKSAEELLSEKEAKLETLASQLKKVNNALDVLLKKREKDKRKIEETVLANINKLVVPYLDRLKSCRLNPHQMDLVNLLESNIKNIISPFLGNLHPKFLNFTPMEIQVANLVKEGKSNKEISELLCLSINTILSHRSRVREKLGLKRKKINLRTYLLTLEK